MSDAVFEPSFVFSFVVCVRTKRPEPTHTFRAWSLRSQNESFVVTCEVEFCSVCDTVWNADLEPPWFA
jgi:hypothetical protein